MLLCSPFLTPVNIVLSLNVFYNIWCQLPLVAECGLLVDPMNLSVQVRIHITMKPLYK